MPTISLYHWVTRGFPRTWTHMLKGGFADPQTASQNATDLFCYDRNAGIGKFFATVKNGRLDNGVLVQDGPYEVGGAHTFSRRWTDIANVTPFQLLFYDASAGIAEIHRTDGLGNLMLQRRFSDWRPSWTNIVPGRFGRAQMLLYDRFNGHGEFLSVTDSGEVHAVSSSDGWRMSWNSIVTGNFSNSPYDDLLFYDKAAGTGEFYRVDGNGGMPIFSKHDNWRTTWAQIVPGKFWENQSYDGLLFYEENGAYTEVFLTNGHGSLSQIQTHFGNLWALPWQAILAGNFIGNMAGGTDLVGYDARDGVLRYFHVQPAVIETVIDLNGRWTDGGTAKPIISVNSTDLTIDMSAQHRPTAHGSIIDNQTISVTFPDDATYSATLRAPGTIRWSNGSAWTKVTAKASTGSGATPRSTTPA